MKYSKSDNAVLADAKATWDASPKVRAEFGNNFESYAAFCRAENRGAVNVLTSGGCQRFPASLPAGGERDDWGDKPLTEARAQWNESADLRAEFFDNFAVFQAYFDAEADGKFKIQSGRTLRG